MDQRIATPRRSTRDERIRAIEFAKQLPLQNGSLQEDEAASEWIMGSLEDSSYVNRHVGESKADAIFAERRELAVLYAHRLAVGNGTLLPEDQQEFDEFSAGVQTLAGLKTAMGPWDVAALILESI